MDTAQQLSRITRIAASLLLCALELPLARFSRTIDACQTRLAICSASPPGANLTGGASASYSTAARRGSHSTSRTSSRISTGEARPVQYRHPARRGRPSQILSGTFEGKPSAPHHDDGEQQRFSPRGLPEMKTKFRPSQLTTPTSRSLASATGRVGPIQRARNYRPRRRRCLAKKLLKQRFGVEVYPTSSRSKKSSPKSTPRRAGS
ncbi:MAG: hypothetical protein Ct9H300mP7_5110 [Verrucomicrobiota bacterium]|nr:MAG: hypothetical protein Ct9H300mP7_5110 [Verrucomicrobiota bacterium]